MGSGPKKGRAKVVSIETLLSGRPAPKYDLRLYIAGSNVNSYHAINNTRHLCDVVLPGRVNLEIIDLYQQPALAARDDVVAAPALVKVSPAPRRMFIGDMADTERLLAGLGIRLPGTKHDRFEPKTKTPE